MIDSMQAIQRLRYILDVDNKQVINFEDILSKYFPVVVVVLPNLAVFTMFQWFQAYQLPVPKILTGQNNIQLHAGIIARGGGAVIFLNGVDDAIQRRYSLAHEAGHYFMDHFFPRQDIIKRLGISALEIVDGLRSQTPEERMHAILNHTSLTFFTHFFENSNQPEYSRSTAESHADAFSLEALAPSKSILSLLSGLMAHSSEIPRVMQVLETQFCLPYNIAYLYAHHICYDYGCPPDIRRRFNI